jgi:hypothetical protein
MTNTSPVELQGRGLIDRTGSMTGMEDVVVDGMNLFIHNLASDPLVRTMPFEIAQFDSMGHDIMRRGILKDLAPLVKDEYKPRALTPLLDAVGSALTDNVKSGVRYIVSIFTDGLENASRKYTLEQIKALVKQRLAEGWKIIFLGANIDAWQVARDMGIPPETTMNVHTQGRNTSAPGQQPGVVGRLKSMLGGSSHTSPVVLALGAAAALAVAYAAMRPGSAQAASLGFTDTDRNNAMGVDGVNTTWQQAVQADIDAFDEPLKSIADLPDDLFDAHTKLPENFDASLGSIGADGNQLGGFDSDVEVVSPDDVPLAQDEAGNDQDDDRDDDQDDEDDSDDRQSELADADSGDDGDGGGGGDGGGDGGD